MATPGTRTRRPVALLPVGVLVLAVLVGFGIALARGDGGGGTPAPALGAAAPTVTVPVAARSATTYAALGDLVAASDVVVRARVVGIARGRTIGQPGDEAAVVSRLVTLVVDEVLAAGADALASGGQLVVEEEGWLGDGRSIALNGAAPPRAGDDGVWFLAALDDPDLPLFVTVGTQGRYLARGATALEGTDPTDPLVAATERLSVGELGAQVRALA